MIYPDPGFPIYESMTRFVGATPVPCRSGWRTTSGWTSTSSSGLVTPRTRLLIINSPANPTGGVFTRADIERIAEIALRHDLTVLADEIYGRIVYDGEHVSIASLPGMAERTIVLDGFSKTYAMTGWRLGYAILPEPLLPPFSRLVINSVSCTSSHSQIAAVEALTGPQDAVDAMVAEFRARRDLIVDGLNAIPGVSCLPAGRRVLRLPRHQRHRPDRRPAGRPAAQRGRRLGPGRDGLRRARSSQRPDQLRQLAKARIEALSRIKMLVEPLVAAHA